MGKVYRLLYIFLLLSEAFAQTAKDSIPLRYPVRDYRLPASLSGKNPYALDPPGLKRTVEYDPAGRRYIIYERLGNQLYRPPRYLNFEEYQRYEAMQMKQDNWKTLSDTLARHSTQRSLIPSLNIKSRTFERIFGGTHINIRPQGSFDLIAGAQVSRNENPLFSERLRKQTTLNFDQRIQMNLVGQVGSRLRIASNYNTDAQFDFENQVKLDYKGGDDDILQSLEAGNVSMPLNSSLITGTQALFGIKTNLKFGRLNVTSVFSQQRSQHKEITVSNGAQQNQFRISADNYDANRHFFLAQYFREHFNEAMSSRPLLRSAINITKIEVWVTNRNNSTTDSRDILALMDLGESRPYDSRQSLAGGSQLPAGGPLSDPAFPQQSNNLLRNLFSYSPDVRNTHSNTVISYFQSNGATDNYARLTYARKLAEKEYTLNSRLGYISLNAALNADEVLAVAFRYSYNGQEYQVGEFSTDVPVNPASPSMLMVKLLKNEILKTNLPSWDLMMKNVYSLGAFQVSRTDFRLNVYRLDESSGVENPVMREGQSLNGQRWMEIMGLDKLSQNNALGADGYFDFLEGVSIDPQLGRIIFPTIEPFGADLSLRFGAGEDALRQRYVFEELYRLTKADAQQFHAGKNRYLIKGTYQSESGSEFMLNAINIPQGSVQVLAGTIPLSEGKDFTVDYDAGRVRILNQSILNSGQAIKIRIESNELFGMQQRALFGTHLNYQVNDKLSVGGTVMNLTEKPFTAKVNINDEPVSNTIWGLDMNYSSDSPWLTRLLNKLPFVDTRAPSSISFSAEYARLVPGHPDALNFAGSKSGVSYLDDFEGTRTVIDLKSAMGWQLSGTPNSVNGLFPEHALSNDLSYGYNRARLAFYNIDPVFYNRSGLQNAPQIPTSREELSNHYVREVLEQEVFPLKQSVVGQALYLPTLDLAFYPTLRGPYNYATKGLNSDGTLALPKKRWGGIFRKLDATDFEAQNVGFIEFWMMDPFIYKKNSEGGDLYFNLGNISEDILKDGRKSLENGLAPDGSATGTESTAWGRVPLLQPVIQAFDNDPQSRKFQDAGLDGLTDADERSFFGSFLNEARASLSPAAAESLSGDPSSDNYSYFRGGSLDASNPGILKRYEKYNGPEGNSKTPQQAREELGVENAASTALPDGEDVNRDNNMSVTDEFFEYKVSIRPQDLQVGQNFISDKVTSSVKLANGSTQQVSWYQFRIPVSAYQGRVGNIENFKSIRFIRMFMTNFADTSVLRMARLQLVRGEWRTYNANNSAGEVLVDPEAGTSAPDNSAIDVGTVNIEENGKRSPIPYVVPPGIQRERDMTNINTQTQLNEQSLSLNVRNLRDGYTRAAFKTSFNDFRSYKNLEMFIHAEGEQLNDGDIHAVLRIGSDYNDNYYEYDVPLKVSPAGSTGAYQIWPEVNNVLLELRKLQEAKAARNKAGWVENLPFAYADGSNTIFVKGQPDMSKVRIYMLGVRNPLQGSGGGRIDDGLDKTAQVWFNEMRLSGFDERGGWGATARLNAQLADIGDVSVSASRTTVGFGSIDQSVSERNRSDDRYFDISTGLELGKFMADKDAYRIPLFISYSSRRSIPQFDPRSPDLELDLTMAGLSRAQRDSVHRIIDDLTIRRGFNLNNIRKLRTDPSAPVHLWDIENFSAGYAFNEYDHRDFLNAVSLQKNYRADFAYTYSGKAKPWSPLAKLIRSENLALLRDLNINLVPSMINFRVDMNRLYGENSLRDIYGGGSYLQTTYNKNFNMTRVYGLSWNLTRSLQLDFSANNYSIIDEPVGPNNKAARDSLMNNLKRLGRTTNYNHQINLNYIVPVNKIPGLRWTSLVARYATTFSWIAENLATIQDPSVQLGNAIQNSRTFQLNPTLNFNSLYNRWGLDRKNNPGVKILTAFKNVAATYTSTEGMYLPGYLPRTRLFGIDFNANAPGMGFVLGSQKDIRQKAVQRGWITTDTLQNQLFYTTQREDFNIRATLEPFRSFRIEITAMRAKNKNYSSNFRFSSQSQQFENMNPITTGDYTISWFSIGTAFGQGDGKELFRKFEASRSKISQRLGQANINSSGSVGSYADGYSKSAQEVIAAAFLSTYSGIDPEKVSLSAFPGLPLPNWRISWNGLTRNGFLSEVFSSVDINHAYRSTYTVSGYNSLIRYRENRGSSYVRDVNGDFLPRYQFSQLLIFEQFMPLLGLDMRMKNNMSLNFEFRKARGLSMSLANAQLSQLHEQGLVLGMGYRSTDFRFPFGILANRKSNNDITFKLDVAVDDRKTQIYRADVSNAEVAAGAKNISFRPSVDYMLNRNLNLRLFYDSNSSNPYTSQAFYTSYNNFGINLRYIIN